MVVDPAPEAGATAPRHGLAVALDTLVAPQAAFAALRERPSWVWAFAIVAVLGTTGALLQVPAGTHIAVETLRRDAPAGAASETAVTLAVNAQRSAWLVYPVIAAVAIAVAALVLLAGNAIGRGRADYARLFAVAANVAIVNYGIAYGIIGLLAAVRGADAFVAQRDLMLVVPSAAWLVPHGPAKLVALLAGLNPFSLWSFVLLAWGMRGVANVSTGVAYATAAVVDFGPLLFTVPLAK